MGITASENGDNCTYILLWKLRLYIVTWGGGQSRATEDGMVRRHHWLNGQESEQTPGDSEGQGSLACRSPWSCEE